MVDLSGWLRRIRFSLTVKLFFIGLLISLLTIPLLMIDSVVDERQARRAEAETEVSQRWGGAQTVTGPILAVPVLTAAGNRHTAYLLPETLSVNGTVQPEIRYRGIYEVVLYSGTLTLDGSFKVPDLGALPNPAEKILWPEAELLVRLSDLGGIKENIRLQWDTAPRSFEPDPGSVGLPGHGLRAPLGLAAAGPATPPAFHLELNLNGSRQLQFVPLGRETNVTLASAWPHPSFNGNYLPVKREIGGAGFSAQWQVFYLSRNYPQLWQDRPADPAGFEQSAFGVEFLFPVDNYQKATRSIKYGMMFIVLTFVAFFLFELLLELRIHPIQYLLVGFALCLFYLLLLSLSEHFGFGAAYSAASAGIVALITGYSVAVLRKARRAATMTAILAALYGYLYVLLQVQDYALLCGSLGLFFILGLIMYLTRNINWYETRLPSPPAEPPPS